MSSISNLLLVEYCCNEIKQMYDNGEYFPKNEVISRLGADQKNETELSRSCNNAIFREGAPIWIKYCPWCGKKLC